MKKIISVIGIIIILITNVNGQPYTISTLIQEGYTHLNNGEQKKAFENFLKASNQGDPIGDYWCGYMYYQGWGIEKNINKCKYHWERAAEKNQSESEFMLGYLMLTDPSFPKDYNYAYSLILRSANHGNVAGMTTMGDLELEKDKCKAFEWYQKGATAQSPAPLASYMTGINYAYGICTEINIELGCQYLRSSAEADYTPAQYELANLYWTNNDIDQCRQWIYKVNPSYLNDKEKEGYYYLMGHIAFGDKNYDLTINCLSSVEKLDSPSEYALGKSYFIKDSIKNVNLYMNYFTRAAENKYPPALYSLGKLYISGTLIKQDTSKGKAYLNKACEEGYAEACLHLGEKKQLKIEDNLHYLIKTMQAVDKNEGISIFGKEKMFLSQFRRHELENIILKYLQKSQYYSDSIISYIEASILYKNVNPDYSVALKYAKMAEQLSMKHRNFKFLALSYNEIGETYLSMSNITQAAQYFNKSIDVYNSLNYYDENYVLPYCGLAQCYMLSSLQDTAYTILKKFENFGLLNDNYSPTFPQWKSPINIESLDDNHSPTFPQWKSPLYKTLAEWYSNNNDYENAVKYQKISNELEKFGDNQMMNMLKLIEYLIKNNSYQEALEYCNNSLELYSIRSSFKLYSSMFLLNKALIYSKTKDSDNSISCVKQALENNYDNLSILYKCCEILAQYYYENKDYKRLHDAIKSSVNIYYYLLYTNHDKIQIDNIHNITNSYNPHININIDNLNSEDSDCQKIYADLYDYLLLKKSFGCSSISSNDFSSKLKRLYEKKSLLLDNDDYESVFSIELINKKLDSIIYRSNQDPYGNNFTENSYNRIKSQIENDEVAIEFLLMNHNYYALIITKEKQNVSLKKIISEDALKNYFNYGNKYIKYDNLSRELYNHIWGPLEQHIHNKKRIYFVPDGLLYSMNIESLLQENNTRLNDKKEVYRLTSTNQMQESKETHYYKNAYLYGDIKYDNINIQNTFKKITLRSLNNDTVRNGWGELIYSNQEIQEIKEILNKQNILSIIKRDSMATEESFKSISGNSPSIIHLSTHGFYLGRNDSHYGSFSNPLKRSGLLMAGAKDSWEKENRNKQSLGILTAEEVSYLDLSNTELLVLSACQTGLGDINEDGVQGLYSAFKLAGVKTIVMTLWEVNDLVAYELMTKMYTYMSTGMNVRESLKRSQEDIRKEYPQLTDWAAFVVVD